MDPSVSPINALARTGPRAFILISSARYWGMRRADSNCAMWEKQNSLAVSRYLMENLLRLTRDTPYTRT